MEKTNYFQLNKNKIGYLGDNFKSWFRGMKSTPKKVKLYSFILPKSMNDEAILKEYKQTACTLNDIAWYMKNDETLKDKWNVFYVKDKDNVLRAVRVGWYAGFHGWVVGAREVTNPYEWSAGSRVFSRLQSVGKKDKIEEDTSLEKRIKELETFREKVESVLKLI